MWRFDGSWIFIRFWRWTPISFLWQNHAEPISFPCSEARYDEVGCFALGLFRILRQHIEWTHQNKTATGQQPNCRDGTTKDYWSPPWHGKPVGHLLSCLSSRRFLGNPSNFAIPRRWHAQSSRMWPSSKQESQFFTAQTGLNTCLELAPEKIYIAQFWRDSRWTDLQSTQEDCSRCHPKHWVISSVSERTFAAVLTYAHM